MMDIRQLKYFLAVAEEGLVTKAADRLHITQSPLSQQMILLEKELGVQLLQRTKKHIGLTEAGHVLKRRAEQLLDLTQLTMNEVRETANGIRGKLTIGTINSSGRLLLPEVIRLFHQTYPLISFDLRQGDTQRILELLNSHLIDIGFVRLPVDSFLYASVTVPTEGMVMVANSHDITVKAEEIPLAHLKDFPLLIHRRYETIISDYFHQNGFEPNIFCTSDEIVPLLTWSLRRLGIAIVPEFAINLLSNPSLIVKKITKPIVSTSSALIWRKNEQLPVTATHFINMFRKKDITSLSPE
ncbi:LysR family transcriptional regulator [Pectinatus frisingensis]|uniref:LysR family transcriptional regulator n=1 Tax=Pectinatus frisingensis TaxID=865 RepID=UPI0018C77F12|nr:LysR family transcriptional regulator [Pectinatus frisingensis]